MLGGIPRHATTRPGQAHTNQGDLEGRAILLAERALVAAPTGPESPLRRQVWGATVAA
jgi:hypothetical protein